MNTNGAYFTFVFGKLYEVNGKSSLVFCTKEQILQIEKTYGKRRD